MKKQNTSTNTLEQLDDLLEKGILTTEEYEAKKQQISLTDLDTSQGQSKQSLFEKAKQFCAVVSPKLAPVKAFAMKRKKLTCAVLALFLLFLGFVPGYSVGKKHTSNVRVTFGSADEAIEVKGKGSQKNPYHLNEDIVFETYDSECGKYVTYTVNISRVMRASALTRYMASGMNYHDEAGLIGKIKADWKGNEVASVSLTPDIGIVYQDCSSNDAIWHSIYYQDGTNQKNLSKGIVYSDVIFKSTSRPTFEFDHAQINYKTKDADGKMVEYKIYIEYDMSAIES